MIYVEYSRRSERELYFKELITLFRGCQERDLQSRLET